MHIILSITIGFPVINLEIVADSKNALNRIYTAIKIASIQPDLTNIHYLHSLKQQINWQNDYAKRFKMAMDEL